MIVSSEKDILDGLYNYIIGFTKDDINGYLPTIAAEMINIVAQKLADDILKDFDIKQITPDEIKDKVLTTIAAHIIEKMIKAM